MKGQQTLPQLIGKSQILPHLVGQPPPFQILASGRPMLPPELRDQVLQSTVKSEKEIEREAENKKKVVEDEDKEMNASDIQDTYCDYYPSRVKMGKLHPVHLLLSQRAIGRTVLFQDAVMEATSLSAILPPFGNYQLSLDRRVIERGLLSSLQLESVSQAGSLCRFDDVIIYR